MPLGVVFILLANLLSGHSSCARLLPPVEGPIVRTYAPVGAYGGHWGIDLAAAPGTVVTVAAAGTVTFAGSVARRLSVTVSHGGGLRTSYTYLDEIWVRRGQILGPGALVGASGSAHGNRAVHLSVRLGDRYQDPLPWLRCSLIPAPALRLAAVHGSSVYPRKGATRHPWWNVRPPSPGAPVRRRDGISRTRSRRGHVPPGGVTMAEGGEHRVAGRASVGDDPTRRRRRGLFRGR